MTNADKINQRITGQLKWALTQRTFNNREPNAALHHMPRKFLIEFDPAFPTQRIGNAGDHME
jgi:hypothetical protein